MFSLITLCVIRCIYIYIYIWCWVRFFNGVSDTSKEIWYCYVVTFLLDSVQFPRLVPWLNRNVFLGSRIISGVDNVTGSTRCLKVICILKGLSTCSISTWICYWTCHQLNISLYITSNFSVGNGIKYLETYSYPLNKSNYLLPRNGMFACFY